MKEIVEKVLEELDKSISLSFEGDKPKFSREGYTSFEISKKNFHDFDLTKDDIQIGFVDGGNIEIFGSANFSLQLIRIYGCVFLKNKKIKEIKNEFFILIKSVGGDEIRYNCEIFPIKGQILVDKTDLELSSTDETIKEGIFRGNIRKIGDIARRFSELKMAETIVDKGIVVIDGTLEKNYTNEEKYLENLYNHCVKNEVLVTALAKTTVIFTEKGNNMIGLLNSIGDTTKWYYHPVVEIKNKRHKANMYVIKLNKKSRYVFRFEVYKEHKYDIKTILGVLASNSSDLAFPGYPYGLITADKFARVSNKEKNYYISLFNAKIGKKGEKLARYLSSADTHSILDNQN